MKLARRWLHALGSKDPQCHAIAAWERAQRWPRPMGWLWPLAMLAVDWLGPLLLLGRLQLAHNLDDAGFDALEQRLHHHRWVPLRGLTLLARMPLWDALAEQPLAQPEAKTAHPLTERLERQSQAAPRPQLVPTGAGDFDVVIIGSGAGGAPVARQLAQSGLRVAVLEAGGIVVSQPPLRALESAYLRQGMTLSMSGVLLPVLAGQGAGGTTPVNSGTCLRPPLEWLERWDIDTGGSFARDLPLWLGQAEQALEVGVPPRSLLGPSAARFEAGLTSLGRSGAYVLPRNAPGCEGASLCCFGCPTGAKRSTDRGLLPEAMDAGAALYLHTRVGRIEERAAGVTVHAMGPMGPQQFRARHLVIAAGALQTPGLVRQSQLGRWQQAGDGLRIHPASKVLALFDDPVLEGRGVPQGLGYQPPELPRIVLEGIHTPTSALAPLLAAAGQQARRWRENPDHLASFGLMLRDRTTGSVRMAGQQPLLRYRPNAQDTRDLVEGIRLAGQTWLAAGARSVLLPIVGADPEVRDLAGIDRVCRPDVSAGQLYACGFHPQGTAGIGRVVDADLRLTPRISICDASVLPDSPGVNPQLTIVALALRLADRLRGELQVAG